MKGQRLTRLLFALFAALALAPFAAAQSGGQDGPLVTQRLDDDSTKGPPKGDSWMPLPRPTGPPPPDARDDDGTVPDVPDVPDGSDDDGDKADDPALADPTGVELDGSWELRRDGSSTIHLTFRGPVTLAQLGVELEGQFFELALVQVTPGGTTLSLPLTAAQTQALAAVAFVLQPVPEACLVPELPRVSAPAETSRAAARPSHAPRSVQTRRRG